MAEGLIKYETIDADQIKEIMQGKEPSPPEGWEAMKLAHKPKRSVKTRAEDKTKPSPDVSSVTDDSV